MWKLRSTKGVHFCNDYFVTLFLWNKCLFVFRAISFEWRICTVCSPDMAFWLKAISRQREVDSLCCLYKIVMAIILRCSLLWYIHLMNLSVVLDLHSLQFSSVNLGSILIISSHVFLDCRNLFNLLVFLSTLIFKKINTMSVIFLIIVHFIFSPQQCFHCFLHTQ